jgi:hypothetical protein
VIGEHFAYISLFVFWSPMIVWSEAFQQVLAVLADGSYVISDRCSPTAVAAVRISTRLEVDDPSIMLSQTGNGLAPIDVCKPWMAGRCQATVVVSRSFTSSFVLWLPMST